MRKKEKKKDSPHFKSFISCVFCRDLVVCNKLIMLLMLKLFKACLMASKLREIN